MLYKPGASSLWKVFQLNLSLSLWLLALAAGGSRLDWQVMWASEAPCAGEEGLMSLVGFRTLEAFSESSWFQPIWN